MSQIVVHTGAGPDRACPEESRILNAATIPFIRRGPCKTPQELIDALQDADVSICFGEPYTREVFANAPRLKAVIRTGVGVDTVDLDGATEFGVMVVHYPDFCIPEVANHALVLILACAKKIVRMDHVMRREGWAASRAFISPMGQIHGETVGLVAFGHIAQAMAKRARCLDMHVIAYDPFVDAAVAAEAGVELVSLEELAARADYVSCHLPLTKQTEGLLDAAFFAAMKPTAYFINTGRGGVVNEPDLIAALQAGRIAGAGLDVFAQEPIGQDHPFLQMDNVILAPHSASYADETMRLRDERVGHDAVTVIQGGVPKFIANRAVLAQRRT